MTESKDQSFDSLMGKFANNIYGSTKGQLRHQVLMHQLRKYINLEDEPLNIIDVGGGTGIMAKEMSDRGHQVLFNDLSQQAVDFAKQTLEGAKNVRFQQQNLNLLDARTTFDVVICHAVLEWLNEPYEAIAKLVELTQSGGMVSLSFFNKEAHRFGNILYGNFDYVDADMQNKNTVRLNPNQALSPHTVLDKLASMPVKVIATAGIRCFHDYLKDREKQQQEYENIKRLELTYCEDETYKWLGKYFHIIFQVN